MYLTTGASSTSASSSLRRRPVPASLQVDLEVLEVGHVLEVAPDARRASRSRAPSLSSSTTSGSTTRLVLNRTSSSACRLAGSDTATNRRLPRFASGSTRRDCDIFGSKNSFWNWSRSNDERSSSGTPNARDANTASCAARHPLALQDLLDEGDARGGRPGSAARRPRAPASARAGRGRVRVRSGCAWRRGWPWIGRSRCGAVTQGRCLRQTGIEAIIVPWRDFVKRIPNRIKLSR